jgi:thiamine-phosphate pyrophosphorylase
VRVLKHSLYLIAASDLAGERPLEKVVKEAVAGGVDVIQLRERNLHSKGIYSLAKKIKETTDTTSARLLINDRVDIAMAVGADGVHLGQNGIPVETVRRMVGHGMVIGVSTHNLEEAKKAENEGADYIFFSPVFATRCKPGADPKGIDALLEICSLVDIPVVALGGVNETTLPQLVARGVTNAAVMSAILTSKNPKQTASQLKAILTQVI